MKKCIAAFVSCIDERTGEGKLAASILRNMDSNDVLLRTFGFTQRYRNNTFYKYIFPQFLLMRAIFFKIFHRDRTVIFLNYCPLWNPLLGLATKFGVKLGPITGSLISFNKIDMDNISYYRKILLPLLCKINLILLCRNQEYLAATNSVYELLKSSGIKANFCPVGVLAVQSQNLDKYRSSEKEIDLFCYSGVHPMKNLRCAIFVLTKIASLGFKCFLVGYDIGPETSISYSKSLPEDEFLSLLGKSRVLLFNSFEDGGIVPYQALALGVPVICNERSSLSVLFSDCVLSVENDILCSQDSSQISKIFDAASSNKIDQSKVQSYLSYYYEAYAKWINFVTKKS